jgi:hypothetical protein
MQKGATRRLLMMTISAASSSAIPGQTGPNPEADAAETFSIETFLAAAPLPEDQRPAGGILLARPSSNPSAPTDWSVQVLVSEGRLA